MKICLLTPYYIPVRGGISNYVFHLSRNLDGKITHSYIIANKGGKDSENVYINNTNKIFFICKALLQIKKIRPDVLHSHAHWYVLAPCVIYKILNPRTIVLHTFHTDPAEETKGMRRTAMKLLLSSCDVLTFVSEYLRDKILKNFDLNIETKIIYGGSSQAVVDEEEIYQFKKKFNLENHFPVLSFVGALSWKMKAEGVKILIKSFKHVSEKFPESRLLIIGDGKYRKELENIVEELGITSQVIFTGFVDNALIPLSVSDIYTHISLQEGFPLAVVEAMSLGKPVIATNIGGIPEVINNGKNGVLVEPSELKIGTEILRLLEDRGKMKELGVNARQTIEENYTWKKIANDYIKIYTEMSQ